VRCIGGGLVVQIQKVLLRRDDACDEAAYGNNDKETGLKVAKRVVEQRG
jgi:hypothetical protein